MEAPLCAGPAPGPIPKTPGLSQERSFLSKVWLGLMLASAIGTTLILTMTPLAPTDAARSTGSALPLERFRLFSSRDVDEARDHVARIFCPHELSPLERERSLDACHHNALLHRDVSLNYVQYGPAKRIEPGCLGDFYLLQIPLRGGASVRCGGREIESHPLLASFPSPTEPLSMRWHADSPQLIVKLDRHAMRQRLESLLQTALREPLVFELGADLTAPAAQGVVGFIAYLRSMLDGEHPLLDRGLLAEQAESHLLTSILLSLRHNHSDRLTMSGLRDERITTVLPRIVKRSQDYMRAHAEAPITLADVCQHVGVSARSLQLAFHRHHGVSPMEFLRELRLDLVHRALLAGADPTLKVSEVAARYGFLHLGHFAARYRERFAQTPSDTLARSKRR